MSSNQMVIPTDDKQCIALEALKIRAETRVIQPV